MSQEKRSIIRSIEIHDPIKGKLVRLFPDRPLQYWDASVTEDKGVYWYYQMHLATVLDMIYTAGKEGKEVKMQYNTSDVITLNGGNK